jgi:hypothetical protein
METSKNSIVNFIEFLLIAVLSFICIDAQSQDFVDGDLKMQSTKVIAQQKK